MAPTVTVAALDAMDDAAFVAALGHVYEDSPHLAAAAGVARPFGDRDALVAAFEAVADALDADAGLALLRAHPELGARVAMGDASRSEQTGAGLTADDPLVVRIQEQGRAYRERFGFPFIIAVKGLGPADIAAALDRRSAHDESTERAEALRQVQRIARLRIEAAVAP